MIDQHDPWDWTKQQSPMQSAVPPMNNTLVVPPSGQAQAPAPIHGPPGIGQMAQTILVARGVNKGLDVAEKKYFPADKAPPKEVVSTETSAPLSNQVAPAKVIGAEENAAREANATGRTIASDGSSGAAPTTATTAPAVAPTSTAAETGAVAGATTAAATAPTTMSEAAMLLEEYGPFLAAQGTTSVPYRTVGNTGKGGK